MGALDHPLTKSVRFLMKVPCLSLDHLLCACFGCRLNDNKIGPSGASAIAGALKVNAVLTSCDLGNNGIGVEGAKALASALEVNGVLTKLDLQYTGLNEDSKQLLRNAVGNRENFDLML